MKNCRICDGEISKSYTVREMLLGTRDTFEYLECGSCGCLQIAEIPDNLLKYYPDFHRTANVAERLILAYRLNHQPDLAEEMQLVLDSLRERNILAHNSKEERYHSP